MKRIIVLFFAIIFSLGLFSQSVSVDEAVKIGAKYYMQNSSEFNYNKSQAIILNQKLLRTEFGNDAFYVLNYKNGGFVLVSADRRTTPILAYSFEDSFNSEYLAPANREWIDQYMKQLDLIIENNVISDIRLETMWNEALNEPVDLSRATSGVDELISTKWNQDDPYNYLCPEHQQGPGGHVYAGCVATAMAQVMKYWNYPEIGRGEKELFWGIYQTINFGETYYNWDEMSSSINPNSRDAIAELIFHCGVSVDMNYSYTGSGALISTAFFALKQNFRYRSGIENVDKFRYEDDEWKFLLREDLDKGHPILYRGNDAGSNGHAFVCDGYQDTSYFHFNWGWGGYGNGFYYLDNINPQMSFHYSQGALINITPNYEEYCNSMVYNQKDWTFDDGSGPNYYFNNQNCGWLISLIDHNVEFIKINFSKFNTLEGDVLTIYEGNSEEGILIGEYSVNDIPSELIVYNDEVFFKFVTNSQGQSDGWEVNYSTSVLGVDDNEIFSDLTIYPNPADNELNILGITEKSDIVIYDISGKVQNESHAFNRALIDISDLANGVYFVRVKNDNHSKVFKFVKN